MCRHLAYLGAPAPLSAIILDPPHSLVHQSWAPEQMRGGSTINADGFGIGWLPSRSTGRQETNELEEATGRGPGEEPGLQASPQVRTALRYRREIPMWADRSLPDLAESIVSGTVLAAVRSATAGMSGGEFACAPFATGRWLFSHNGVVTGWPSSLTSLMAELAPEDLLTLEAPTDSATLWAIVRHRLRAGIPPARALTSVVADVAATAPGSRLNLLLTDGEVIVATTWGHSLWTARLETGVAVSSEPWDAADARWLPVAEHHLVHATRQGIDVSPIDDRGPAGATGTAMSPPTVDVHLTPGHADRALRSDARLGLAAASKWLPPKWFYDARGSQLFEQITRLPEYYPTRAERQILDRHANDIARLTAAHTLVELGSGSSEKTRLLLDALCAHGSLHQFVPLDVSESALRDAVDAIHDGYPRLKVHGVVGDFTEHLGRVPGQAPRLVAFLGGTIGNLFPEERSKFLGEVRDVLSDGEWLLLGTDLVKRPEVLVSAYDDAAGVTADFNLNVLRVLNRELGADFDLTAFEHVAIWDEQHEWIEMRLRATHSMTVRVPGISMQVDFAAGESMRTEISAKFRREQVQAELTAAGFKLVSWLTDDQDRFALSLAQAG